MIGSDERFTFPDEEPVDDEDYFQFSPRHGVVRAKHVPHAPHHGGKGGGAVGVAKQPITSHTSHFLSPRGGAMTNQMTLPPALLRKQLEMTLKKLSVVMKEKSALQERLDGSGIASEVDRLQDTVARRDADLSWLQKDNRSLQNMVRSQAKQLAA